MFSAGNPAATNAPCSCWFQVARSLESHEAVGGSSVRQPDTDTSNSRAHATVSQMRITAAVGWTILDGGASAIASRGASLQGCAAPGSALLRNLGLRRLKKATKGVDATLFGPTRYQSF